MFRGLNGKVLLVLATLTFILFSSCTRRLGWGMLLWSAEDPPIPSGTILPVYIRSNIDHVWVVGIPQEYRRGGGRDSGMDKFEVPLAQLELVGGKRKAIQRAAEFSAYARTYAETLQDGLPIRDNPDNGSKRVYRLRAGEIVKVLSSVQGAPAISTSGDPLPGEWFRVLTENGSAGYCFSYRLRVFEHAGGALGELPRDAEEVPDPDLDELLSKVWSPESYSLMVTTRRIDLEELSRRWGFDPGQDTGIAQIRLPDLDRSFSYTAIRSTGSRSWRFEGARLEMSLQSNTTLAVHFTDDGGALRSLIFVALPSDVEDLMVQESARRDELFFNIYDRGPVYTSNNYGTLAFTMEGRFEWAGNYLLIPQIIPASALGSGRVSMGLFLSPSMESRFDVSLRRGRWFRAQGAFPLHPGQPGVSPGIRSRRQPGGGYGYPPFFLAHGDLLLPRGISGSRDPAGDRFRPAAGPGPPQVPGS